jgi:hypothetical protein
MTRLLAVLAALVVVPSQPPTFTSGVELVAVDVRSVPPV